MLCCHRLWTHCIYATDPSSLTGWSGKTEWVFIVRAGTELNDLALTWEIAGLIFLSVQIYLIYSHWVSSKASSVLAWDLWRAFHAWQSWPAWRAQSRSHVSGNVTLCQAFPDLVGLHTSLISYVLSQFIQICCGFSNQQTKYAGKPCPYVRSFRDQLIQICTAGFWNRHVCLVCWHHEQLLDAHALAGYSQKMSP